MKKEWAFFRSEKLRNTVLVVIFFLKAFSGTFSLSENALDDVEWGYPTQIPLIKYIFPIFQNMQGWGIENLFVFAGICALLYLVRKASLQKNKYLTGFSVFFAVCTVFGQSYYKAGDWSLIFHGRLQFGLAVIVGIGYYILFKNCIVLFTLFLAKFDWKRTRAANRLEKLFFEKHPFLAPLLLFLVLAIPFWIGFFPGTLQFDGLEQIWCFLGAFPWTNKHPAASTWFMGKCLELGRILFHSNNMGYFFYTGSQALSQWLVFAYGMYVLSRIKCPIIVRTGALLYLGFFPLWRIWSATYAKDGYFYIWVFLMTTAAIDIASREKTGILQYLLLSAGAVGAVQFRHNGKYIVAFMVVFVLLFARKYWKPCLVSFAAVLLSVFIVEGIYIPHKNIGEPYIRESMSVLLQQTARYLKEHGDDVTEEEKEVLNHFFHGNGKWEELPELYNPELSDPVKEWVLDYPTKEELKDYLGVWWKQFLRHPDTYVQAYLNQIYGYFYPDRESFHDRIGHYTLGWREFWQDDNISIWFASKEKGRDIRHYYEQVAELVNRMPVLSLLYSTGFHNLLLLGMTLYLLAKKKWKQTAILIPSLVTVLICLVSPVNAYIRYMMPVMALLPMNLAWILYVGNENEKGIDNRC